MARAEGQGSEKPWGWPSWEETEDFEPSTLGLVPPLLLFGP
jgi:hypothetical protein